MSKQPSQQHGSQNQSLYDSQQGQQDQGDEEMKNNDPSKQIKFQSIPLREYYDHSITTVLMEGLRALGKERFIKRIFQFLKRPKNPVRFLGQFLLDRDPEK